MSAYSTASNKHWGENAWVCGYCMFVAGVFDCVKLLNIDGVLD